LSGTWPWIALVERKSQVVRDACRDTICNQALVAVLDDVVKLAAVRNKTTLYETTPNPRCVQDLFLLCVQPERARIVAAKKCGMSI
jgi:hypothetical protein